MRFSAMLRGMVSSMRLDWLGGRLSSSFTSRRRFSGAQGARWDTASQVTACLSLTHRSDSGQHYLLTVWGTLTFQRGPAGVSVQVVLAQAGPCRAAELLQGWAAAPAPQPCRAVAVLGDDGPEAVSCGAEQSRAWEAMGEQGRHESSPRGSRTCGRVGEWVAPTNGAAGHVGQDLQGGRRVPGVLLTLPGLWPGHSTGIWSSQGGWGLWKGEGRMQRQDAESPWLIPVSVLLCSSREAKCVLFSEHPLLQGHFLCPQDLVCPRLPCSALAKASAGSYKCFGHSTDM